MVVICKQYAGHLQPIYILRVICTLYTNHTASIVPKIQMDIATHYNELLKFLNFAIWFSMFETLFCIKHDEVIVL